MTKGFCRLVSFRVRPVTCVCVSGGNLPAKHPPSALEKSDLLNVRLRLYTADLVTGTRSIQHNWITISYHKYLSFEFTTLVMDGNSTTNFSIGEKILGQSNLIIFAQGVKGLRILKKNNSVTQCKFQMSCVPYSSLLLLIPSLTLPYSRKYINPFPNKPWFLRVCTYNLFKTLWEKEKLLVTSNFSFTHSVFNPF